MLEGIQVHGGRLPLIVAYDEIPAPMVNSVATDNRAAARRATRYLFELGHRRIGHIVGHTRNEFPNERLVGFEEEMPRRLASRSGPNGCSRATTRCRPEFARGERFAAMADRPTAMFAGNDEMAIGFISALPAPGRRMPARRLGDRF